MQDVRSENYNTPSLLSWILEGHTGGSSALAPYVFASAGHHSLIVPSSPLQV